MNNLVIKIHNQHACGFLTSKIQIKQLGFQVHIGSPTMMGQTAGSESHESQANGKASANRGNYMVSYDHILIMIIRSTVKITTNQVVLTNHVHINTAKGPQVE